MLICNFVPFKLLMLTLKAEVKNLFNIVPSFLSMKFGNMAQKINGDTISYWKFSEKQNKGQIGQSIPKPIIIIIIPNQSPSENRGTAQNCPFAFCKMLKLCFPTLFGHETQHLKDAPNRKINKNNQTLQNT